MYLVGCTLRIVYLPSSDRPILIKLCTEDARKIRKFYRGILISATYTEKTKRQQTWEISMLFVRAACVCVCVCVCDRESLDVRAFVCMPQYNFELAERF